MGTQPHPSLHGSNDEARARAPLLRPAGDIQGSAVKAEAQEDLDLGYHERAHLPLRALPRSHAERGPSRVRAIRPGARGRGGDTR